VSAGPQEQRNPYKGTPERPWARVCLLDPGGAARELELLVDTGAPCAIILSQTDMAALRHAAAPDVTTNFGLLEGGWLHVAMADLGLDLDLVGYSSDAIVAAARASSPDFQGLVGLPFLRKLEYGGDADWFWLRPAASAP
jgi:hypothetical protein